MDEATLDDKWSLDHKMFTQQLTMVYLLPKGKSTQLNDMLVTFGPDRHEVLKLYSKQLGDKHPHVIFVLVLFQTLLCGGCYISRLCTMSRLLQQEATHQTYKISQIQQIIVLLIILRVETKIPNQAALYQCGIVIRLVRSYVFSK